MIIFDPVHTAECECLAEGAPSAGVGLHARATGSYAAPVAVTVGGPFTQPPQMIIFDPVHTAVWR
jgi:hypothetical protein